MRLFSCCEDGFLFMQDLCDMVHDEYERDSQNEVDFYSILLDTYMKLKQIKSREQADTGNVVCWPRRRSQKVLFSPFWSKNFIVSIFVSGKKFIVFVSSVVTVLFFFSVVYRGPIWIHPKYHRETNGWWVTVQKSDKQKWNMGKLLFLVRQI